MRVKAFCFLADGIHHHGVDTDFFGYRQCTFDGIGKKHLSNTMALHGKIHGQAADERCRYGMFGQLSGYFFRQIRQVDGEGAECVVTQYGCFIPGAASNENAANVTLDVLSGLLLKVAVQRFITAIERRPVMVSIEWLYDELTVKTHLEFTRRSCFVSASVNLRLKVTGLASASKKRFASCLLSRTDSCS